jgi:phage terminase small subunit
MNHKQQIFVSEYLKTGNATNSALKSGYSEKTAYSIGQRLLKKVEIMKAIQEHQTNISNEAELTVSDVVKCIREVALKSESESIKLKAYDMLMKHLGGYVSELKIIESLTDDQIEAITEKLLLKLDV